MPRLKNFSRDFLRYEKGQEITRFKDNKGLLDKKRFDWLEREKRRWLKNLSMKEALRLEESLLSSSFIWELRKNFSQDEPMCLKYSLQKRREMNRLRSREEKNDE